MEKPFVPSLTGLTEETRFWLRGSGHFWTADSEYSRLNDGKLRPTFQEWLPAYQCRETLLKDLGSAMTLGCVLFAQSLAHADLCKVTLITGPYSCLAPPLFYALFGTCVQASIGTGGLISLLTGEQLADFGDLEERTHAGAIFTLLVGVMISAMGIFRLAFLVRFLSKPALSGFISASAILIMLSQVKPAIGLPKSDVGGIMSIAFLHPKELDDLNPATVLFSFSCLIFLQLFKRLKASRSRVVKLMSEFKEVILLLVSSLVSWQFSEEYQIAVIGHVPAGMPTVQWPLRTSDDWVLAQQLLPGAAMVALVTFLSSFAAARKFSLKAGYQVVATNELLGLGAANVAGAFCGAVPTQAGLSRMGIAASMGVKNMLGGNVFTAGMVGLILLLLSPYLFFVPRCALNVIIIIGASTLTEFSHVWWLWSLRSTRTRQRTYVTDFLVWWVAFLFTLFLGALKGILGAVVVSLVLIVYQVADPPITTLGYCQCRHRWLNVKERRDTEQHPGVLAVRPEGPLFYANTERLEEWLDEMEISASMAGCPVKAIILSFAAVSFMDTSALEALSTMIEAYAKRNIVLLVAHASGQPRQLLMHALGDGFPENSLSTPWTVEECVQHLLQQQLQAQEFHREVSGDSRTSAMDMSPMMASSNPNLKVRRVRSLPSMPLESDSDEGGLPSPQSSCSWQIKPLQSSVQWATGRPGPSEEEVICKAEKGRGLRLRTAHPVTLLSLRVALLSLRNRSAKGDQRRSDAESLQLMVGSVRKGRELKRLDYHLSMIRAAMPRSGHGVASEEGMATGHGKGDLERRLNVGLQTLPSGFSAFPVARQSLFHRSINQKMPELWSDFSDSGLPQARAGPHQQIDRFHGDHELSRKAPPLSARPGKVVFVGFAEFDMDGRAFTGGEMDRMMMISASQKYPCSRPATFDEYAERCILGLPERNNCGRDVVFVGPGATGCELFHTNTLGIQKAVVSPHDMFDGTWGNASLYGRKCILCVYPVQRLKKQQSLTQFGLARQTIGKPGDPRINNHAGMRGSSWWLKLRMST
ncbi:Sulfate transporter 4.1 [Durusdinium trenchii]|uniref:Chloroplastic (AST82) n=1 Tax=Durusdinium trenchii TaxID=1381693 RepID=A0ABP0L763_9DINO